MQDGTDTTRKLCLWNKEKSYPDLGQNDTTRKLAIAGSDSVLSAVGIPFTGAIPLRTDTVSISTKLSTHLWTQVETIVVAGFNIVNQFRRWRI